MRKKKRRFKHLLYKHISSLSFHQRDRYNLETNNFYKSECITSNEKLKFEEISEFYDLCDILGVDEEILKLIISKYYLMKDVNRKQYNPKPWELRKGRDRRDNKKIRVGSGGSNYSTLRYPSKKRSRTTWARFYTLFPTAAEFDGWDGKTSKRMK